MKYNKEITSQKQNYLKSKKKSDSEGQETFAFILFYWKLKPSRLKLVDLLTHVLINEIIEVRVLVTMTKKKLR